MASSSSSSTSSASPSSFILAAAQLRVVSSRAANLAAARAAISAAASRGAALVVLPECFNSPYGNEWFRARAEPVPSGPTCRFIAAAARRAGVWVIAGSIPEWVAADDDDDDDDADAGPGGSDDEAYLARLAGGVDEVGWEAVQRGEHVARVLAAASATSPPPEPEGAPADARLCNTSVVFSPEGRMVARHRKVHLFNVDIPGGISFRESDSLSAGCAATVFDTPFCRIGLGICFDIRFPEYAQILAGAGARLLVYPGAFNTTTGPLHWELLARARAVDNQLYVAVVSPARDMSASYHAWGHTSVIDPWGRVVATCDERPELVFAEIDLGVVDALRAQIPVPRRSDVYTSPRIVGR